MIVLVERKKIHLFHLEPRTIMSTNRSLLVIMALHKAVISTSKNSLIVENILVL